MQTKHPNSSAPTDRLLTQNDKSLSRPEFDPDLVDNILAVRQSDGRVAEFDMHNISKPLAESMLAIGRKLDDSGQDLVDELCSSVLNTLSDDIPAKGVIEADDLELQIEMTLRLSGDDDLVEGYLEQQT